MFCSQCGKEINDTATFCAWCGAPVQRGEAAPGLPAGAGMPSDVNKSGGDQTVIQNKSAKQKKSLKVLWAVIILVCVVMLAAGIAAAWYFLSGQEDDSSRDRDWDRSSRDRQESEAEESSGFDPTPSEYEGDEEGRNGTTKDPESDIDTAQPGSDYSSAEYKESSLAEIQAALDAYQRYLDREGFSGNWGSDYLGCNLIYLDNDDIPEMVIYGEYEAVGNILLTYDGSQVYEVYLSRLGFSYLERKNLLCNGDGHMGVYYDIIYSIIDGKPTVVAHGDYGEVYDDRWQPILDENDDLVFEYFWNGQEVSADEYDQELRKVYPDDEDSAKHSYYLSDTVYTSADDAYYAGMKGLIETLGWTGVPQTGIAGQELAGYCFSFVMSALYQGELILQKFPDAYWQDYWINISEEDVERLLEHSIGEADISSLIAYSNTDRNYLIPYCNYFDGRFVMTGPDIGVYDVRTPEFTDIIELSDAQLQVSGSVRLYVENDYDTILFSLRFKRDPDSVWGYCLTGVDRWDTYVLPYVDSRYLTEEDVLYWSEEQLRFARNEIYARHGRRFDDAALQEYFDSRSWYVGTIAPNDFNDSVLNEYEVANRDFLLNYETKMGYR